MVLLRVDKCTSEAISLLGTVEMNPKDVINNPYVRIKNCIYRYNTNKLCPVGTIRLNSNQRLCCDLAVGETVECHFVEKLKEPTDPININISVSPRLKKDIVKITTDVLKEKIYNFLISDHVSMGQKVSIETEYGILLLAIRNIQDIVNEKSLECVKINKLCNFILESDHTSLIIVDNTGKRYRELNFNYADLGVGGLDDELRTIFRRAFVSRLYDPEFIKKSGIKHIRGVLLHGPPGCGKTLLARQIGKMLGAREPKVINGPEVLNKYYGQSEENIRNLFKDAEEEYNRVGDNSELHLIIFDEMDSLFRERGTGSNLGDSVVNQLLSKMDGVNSLNNVLIIGMTNRRDLLDPAMLRPGRFEVQMEIGLPNKAGRRQIFEITLSGSLKNGYLDKSVDINRLADLTENYTGAEISGVVNSAMSLAMSREVDLKNLKKTPDTICVTQEDFDKAIIEVRPVFGVQENTVSMYFTENYVDNLPIWVDIHKELDKVVNAIKSSRASRTVRVLINGKKRCGKSTFVNRFTHILENNTYRSILDFTRVINTDLFIGKPDTYKVSKITASFDDARRMHRSIIVLDDIERIMGYIALRKDFSPTIYQNIVDLLRRVNNPDHQLLVIATTSNIKFLEELDMTSEFDYIFNIENQDIGKILDRNMEINQNSVLYKIINKNIDSQDIRHIKTIAFNYIVDNYTHEYINLEKRNNCDYLIDISGILLFLSKQRERGYSINGVKISTVIDMFDEKINNCSNDGDLFCYRQQLEILSKIQKLYGDINVNRYMPYIFHKIENHHCTREIYEKLEYSTQ